VAVVTTDVPRAAVAGANVDTVAAQAVLQSALLREARASLALDGETQAVETYPREVPPRHFHTPGRSPVVLSERYVGGTRFVVHACCTCGEALPERRA
jgi:hypothetical protein